MKKLIIIPLVSLFFNVQAQYNTCAAKSVITEEKKISVKDEETGEFRAIIQNVPVSQDKRDGFGNVNGNQYDLAVDGAFEGKTIVILQLYGFETTDMEKALKEKGFSVYRFLKVPHPDTLKKALDKSCQFWLVSGGNLQINSEHAAIIKEYFYSGKGVYIWGDNSPFHADADFLMKHLFEDVSMSGTYMGDQAIKLKTGTDSIGVVPDHLITTGIENMYEGITISEIHDPSKKLKPLVYSTDGNVVTAIYEDQGMRLIIDGGFTRLYHKWNTAGTDRFVKNCAAWLVNYERFGVEDVGLKN